MNFQRFKLDLEKAEEPENKLPTFAGSLKKEDNSKVTFTPASLAMLKALTVWTMTNCKILKEMGMLDYLTCLVRNMYASQEATVRPYVEQRISSKFGKEEVKAVYCHPAYLTCIQSTSCEMPGWMKHKLESRLPGETSITSDMQMTPPLWQKVKRN